MTEHALTVVVHGVTGPQGASVARALLADGHRVRGLVRRPAPAPQGADLIGVDVLDADALARAYAGADAVFVHLPTVFDRDRALAQADSIAKALDDSGVRRVVVNPNLAPPPVEVGLPYVDARVRLAQAVLALGGGVVAPAAQYMENLNAPWSAELVTGDGVLAYPLPAGAPIPWVAQDDVARAVVDELTAATPRPLTVVAGPAALTGPDAAAALAEGLGRPVRWETISGARYRLMLAPHVGDEGAAGLGAIYDAVLTGQAPPPAAPDPSTVRTGRTTLSAWAARSPWPYTATAGIQGAVD